MRRQRSPPPLQRAKKPPKVETETEDGRKIIHIKPPIVVKELAAQLGLKNFQLIKELMDDFNIFANPEPDGGARGGDESVR